MGVLAVDPETGEVEERVEVGGRWIRARGMAISAKTSGWSNPPLGSGSEMRVGR
jgi:hypothetical protein